MTNGINGSKTVLLFPGQASQYVGMAKDLYDAFPQVKELYHTAAKILGTDLAKVSFEGPEELLRQTQYTQPAVFVHSVAVWQLIEKNGIKPDYVAGHSLGEYSALVAAGAISFEDALTAVGYRSRLMQQACLERPGTMAAIIGMSAEEIFSLCSEAALSGIVVPANYNSPDQIVISGENQAVERAVELAKQKGKKGILLKVGGAFHSPLMQNAKVELLPELDKLKFNTASVPVVANVTGKAITKPEHIKELLVEQITKPVLWSQSLDYIYNHGIKNYIEIGPGKVLQGLVKKSLGGVEISGMDKLSDMESYLPAQK